MKHFSVGLLLSVTCGAAVISSAQPARVWTRNVGLTMASNTIPKVVRTDSAGNTICFRLKGYRVTEKHQGYGEIVKFSPSGAVLWTSYVIGRGSGLGHPDAMVIDNANNVYAAFTDNFSIFAPTTTLTKLNGATGAKLWETTNGGIYTAYGASLKTSPTNDVFIGGQGNLTNDLRLGLSKLNGATGAIIWSKTITRAAAGISDLFGDMAVDSSGNVALVGTARSSNFCLSSTPEQLVIERINGVTGATLWTTTYTALASDEYNSAKAGVDASGNVFAGGSAFRMTSGVWVCTKRNATTGASMFAKALNPSDPLLANLTGMAVDGTGGVTLMGEAFGIMGSGTYFSRFNSAGAPSWSRLMLNRHADGDDSAGTNRPYLVAIGSSALTTCLSQDVPQDSVAVTRLNLTTGANVWDKTYAPVGKAEARCVAAAPNGDTVFTCLLDNGSDPSAYQAVTGRMLAANGNPVFTNIPANATIPTPEFGGDLLADSAGNLFSTGISASRILTEKVNSVGGLVWQNVLNTNTLQKEPGAYEGGMCLARDGAGNVIVAGTNNSAPVIQKINNATGATIWSRRLTGVFGKQIAVSSGGDVYVPMTQPSQLMKLRGTDGVTLWAAPVDGTKAVDQALYAAVDNAGNPFVCGTTLDYLPCPSKPSQRILVARFNSTTGTKLWASELNNPFPGANVPVGLLAETTGNIQVGGYSDNATNPDYVAARLNGTSGAILWQNRYDNAGRFDKAASIVLDSTNNMFMTGTTQTATVTDGWTIKINMANGAKAWSNFLTIPAGAKVPSDITRNNLNYVFVGGHCVNGGNIQQFGEKINGTTGATVWTALSPLGGVEAPFRNVSVAVSPADRLHILSSVTSPGVSLAQQTLYQLGP